MAEVYPSQNHSKVSPLPLFQKKEKKIKWAPEGRKTSPLLSCLPKRNFIDVSVSIEQSRWPQGYSRSKTPTMRQVAEVRRKKGRTVMMF